MADGVQRRETNKYNTAAESHVEQGEDWQNPGPNITLEKIVMWGTATLVMIVGAFVIWARVG